MDVKLCSDYVNVKDPEQFVQNVDLILRMQKIEFGGHSELLRVARLLVNPYRNFESFGMCMDLHEVGYGMFLKKNPRTMSSNDEMFLTKLRQWDSKRVVSQSKEFFVLARSLILPDLNAGACLIVALKDFSDFASHHMLWKLYQHFQSVKIVKPHMSACCDDSIFVVCEDLLSCWANKDEECPLNWQYWLIQQQNKFTLLKNQWQSKAIKLCEEMLSLNRNLDAQVIKESCLKEKNSQLFLEDFVKTLG